MLAKNLIHNPSNPIQFRRIHSFVASAQHIMVHIKMSLFIKAVNNATSIFVSNASWLQRAQPKPNWNILTKPYMQN